MRRAGVVRSDTANWIALLFLNIRWIFWRSKSWLLVRAEDWQEDDLFALVRRAYPYRNLLRKDFDEIIEMLSNGIAARRGRYGAYLHRDQVNGRAARTARRAVGGDHERRRDSG